MEVAVAAEVSPEPVSIPLAAAVADAAGVRLYRCAAASYPPGEPALQWLSGNGSES